MSVPPRTRLGPYERQLYVRELDHDEARPLAGTEDAQMPAISPDGNWVAFWADRKLTKAPLAGGPSGDVAPAIVEDEPPMGLCWDAAGNLHFARPSSHITTSSGLEARP